MQVKFRTSAMEADPTLFPPCHWAMIPGSLVLLLLLVLVPIDGDPTCYRNWHLGAALEFLGIMVNSEGQVMRA